MAFGGVATGSMKAYDVATAVGIIKYKGFTPIPSACGQDRSRKMSQYESEEAQYSLYTYIRVLSDKEMKYVCGVEHLETVADMCTGTIQDSFVHKLHRYSAHYAQYTWGQCKRNVQEES